MPTYKYECLNKHEFEIQQSIKDEPIKNCLKCNKECKRIIQPTGFVLKGLGWFKDGY